MWTLFEAVELCRDIEERIKDCQAHCALGGSLLYRGTSKKDADIFIYPHNGGLKYDVKNVIDTMKLHIDFKDFERVETKEYDTKTIFKCSFKGKRVDFFFLEGNDDTTLDEDLLEL